MGIDRVEAVPVPLLVPERTADRAPARAARPVRVQTKLAVGRVDDPLEREADRIAETVLRSIGPGATGGGRIRRAPGGDNRLGGRTVDADVARSVASRIGRGVPLRADVVGRVGAVLDHDLSDVRVHVDAPADRLARSLDARAFTTGRDVFVRDDERSEVRSGIGPLLAHELAHVVQQRAVPQLAPAVGVSKIRTAGRATSEVVPRRAPGRIRRSTAGVAQGLIQRNEESAALLTKLAAPIARKGPEIATQKAVVDKLLLQKLPNETLVNLGAIALTKISDDDDELVEQAKKDGLMTTELMKYGYIGSNAWMQVASAGVADGLITNTLRTMIDAEQVKYLRKAGLPNEEYMILVEIHFYLARNMDQWGMHKDTKGSTLFVNLNYHMNQDVVGPETLVNPDPTPAHDEALGIKKGEATSEGTLPKEFLSDLMTTRGKLGEPTTIGNKTVPAYGYVAFVDEAIHHATPLYGHRSVKGKHFKKYLEQTQPAPFIQAAQVGYAKWNKSFTGTLYTAFSDYMDPTSPIPKPDAAKWLEWMKMADDSKAETAYKRPQFLKAGMTNDDIDTMLETVAEITDAEKENKTDRPTESTGFFVDADVPMPGTQTAIRSPLKAKGKPPLKREMSQNALAGKLPAPAEKDRRFFRTWVRAVKRKGKT
jgi:hypothetical protein